MTENNWTIGVREFGPVKQADVTLASLLVLVGENNSGKSYIASLIWRLLNPSRILAYSDQPIASYQPCQAIARQILSGRKTDILKSDWEKFSAWINGILHHRSEEFLISALGHSSCKIGHISIDFSKTYFDLNVKVVRQPATPKFRRATMPRAVLESGGIVFHIRETPDSKDDEYTARSEHNVARTLAARLLFGREGGAATYIPAARTGLMVAYKTLISSLLGAMDDDTDGSDKTTLSPPVSDFLVDLDTAIDFPNQVGEHAKIARDLEVGILGGALSNTDSNMLFYTPTGTDIHLPFYTVSSLVTELAPFIMLLKSGLHNRTLIFEEPESHLHLSAQRALARALIRLVNSGVRVIITTHSDTFLQQINVALYLFVHPHGVALAKELGYSSQELLDPARARGYAFVRSPNGTVVSKIEMSREGFIEPSINNVIAESTKEILRLQECDGVQEGGDVSS